MTNPIDTAHNQYHTLIGDFDTKQARDEAWGDMLLSGLNVVDNDFDGDIATPDELITATTEHKDYHEVFLIAVEESKALRQFALDRASELFEGK